MYITANTTNGMTYLRSDFEVLSEIRIQLDRLWELYQRGRGLFRDMAENSGGQGISGGKGNMDVEMRDANDPPQNQALETQNQTDQAGEPLELGERES